ncbi:MAG: ANTAR domain-containing protein [Lachnospiraceae bacterium]|nr:ANTAR domain-containing protein [Lachnospiraceae bacterium]
MGSIIIVMPTIEKAGKIGGLLSKYGYRADLVCNLAADALSETCRLEDGVIICGSRLVDMSFLEFADCIPKYFKLIILTKNVMDEEYPEDAIKLSLPLSTADLINVIEEQFSKYYHRPVDNKIIRQKRSNEERKYIDKAKSILMKKNGMTEPEAHRYLQKTGMDTGTNMVETARMVILLEGQ